MSRECSDCIDIVSRLVCLDPRATSLRILLILPQVLIAKGILAVATCAGDPTRAAALAADIHARALACLGPRHPSTLHVKALQGHVQLLCGYDAPGARLLREAIAGMRGALGVGHPRLKWATDTLVLVLRRLVRRRLCGVSAARASFIAECVLNCWGTGKLSQLTADFCVSSLRTGSRRRGRLAARLNECSLALAACREGADHWRCACAAAAAERKGQAGPLFI